MIEIIGYLAIIVSAISLTPQIVQMYKTKKVDDINIFFLFISILGDTLYLIYGITIQEIVFIISIIPPVISHLIMILLWFKYHKNINNKNINNKNINNKNIQMNDVII
jgi:uncharacterized protein with PQ loop repeat